MPGAVRPYTLPDVLATIIGGQSQPSTTDTPTGFIAEADEQLTVGDSAATTVQPLPGWDQGVWGVFSWS